MRAERLRILFSTLSVFGLVLIRPAAILPAFDFVQASDAGPLPSRAAGSSGCRSQGSECRRRARASGVCSRAPDADIFERQRSRARRTNRRPRQQIPKSNRKRPSGLNFSVPRNCSALSKSRRRSLRAPSALMPTAVFRVPWRCRSTAPPGRRCDYRAIVIGDIPS